MASRRKVQELDKNVKVLRELAKLPANRQCFDCHQRGPTYVNVTIGSFVCTSCSGLLRGLNPPHRVKSITMTNFTSEEIDFIKQKGNEYCRYVWLGTCDSKACMEPEMRDEHCNRDFMIQKYERKRWYVDPETAVRKMQNEEQQFSETQPCKPEQKGGHVTLVSQNSIPETKPLSTLLGDTAAPLVIQNCKQNTYSWSSSDTLPSEPPRALKSQDINTDIFRDFGKDPFAQNTTANSNETVTTNGSFANFDSIFTAPISDAQSTGQFKTQGFAAFPNSTSAGSFFGQQLDNPSNQTVKTPATDKYAALADLDSIFSQSTHPATTAETAWPATSIRTSSVLGVKPTTGQVYGTDATNPFTNTVPTWSQPGPEYPEQQSYFSGSGSFQGTLPQAAVYGVQAPTHGGSSFSLYGTPTTISASEVNYGAFTGSSASNTSFGFSPCGLGVMNSSESITANQARVPNGAFDVGAITTGWPIGGMAPAGVQSSGVMWNVGTGQQVHMNMLPGDKLDGRLQQPFQVSANPFTVANGPPTQPVKSNLRNPFL